MKRATRNSSTESSGNVFIDLEAGVSVKVKDGSVS